MDDYNKWLHPSSRTVQTIVDGVEHVIATMKVDTNEEGFMQLGLTLSRGSHVR